MVCQEKLKGSVICLSQQMTYWQAEYALPDGPCNHSAVLHWRLFDEAVMRGVSI